jgi:hypothetical protein
MVGYPQAPPCPWTPLLFTEFMDNCFVTRAGLVIIPMLRIANSGQLLEGV